MKITSESEARALLDDRVPHDSTVRLVWTTGGGTSKTFSFLEVMAGGTRVLWHVGPRGGVNRSWTYSAELWKALQ